MTLQRKILIQLEAVPYYGGIKTLSQAEPDYKDDDIIRPTVLIGQKCFPAEPDDIVDNKDTVFICEGCDLYEVLRIFPISLEVAKTNSKTRKIQ